MLESLLLTALLSAQPDPPLPDGGQLHQAAPDPVRRGELRRSPGDEIMPGDAQERETNRRERRRLGIGERRSRRQAAPEREEAPRKEEKEEGETRTPGSP